MENSNPLELVGIKNIIESFFVFLVYGALVILLGSFCIDLTKDLPDEYVTIIQEPISVYMFMLLSMGPSTVIFIVSVFKGQKILYNSIIKKYLLAFPRVGLTAGAIITAMLLGMGIALWLLALGCKHELMPTALKFIGAAAIFSLYAIPLILLHLYLLYPWGKNPYQLDIINLIYVILIGILITYINNYFNWKVAGKLFLPFLFLIIAMKYSSKLFLNATEKFKAYNKKRSII